MTLDEAIKHAEEVAMRKDEEANNLEHYDMNVSDAVIECRTCADEHRQLAEWLKDYKRLLEQQIEFRIGYKYPECGGFMLTESGVKNLPYCNCGTEMNGERNNDKSNIQA